MAICGEAVSAWLLVTTRRMTMVAPGLMTGGSSVTSSCTGPVAGSAGYLLRWIGGRNPLLVATANNKTTKTDYPNKLRRVMKRSVSETKFAYN